MWCCTFHNLSWTDSIKQGLQVFVTYYGFVTFEGLTFTRMFLERNLPNQRPRRTDWRFFLFYPSFVAFFVISFWDGLISLRLFYSLCKKKLRALNAVLPHISSLLCKRITFSFFYLFFTILRSDKFSKYFDDKSSPSASLRFSCYMFFSHFTDYVEAKNIILFSQNPFVDILKFMIKSLSVELINKATTR